MRILLVDDDEDSLYLMKASLNSCTRADFILDTADSGEEALAKLNGSHYDLCLSDYRLRDMTASDLAARAAKKPPMVVVSNFPRESLEEEIERAGFAGFLTKSEADPEALEALILKITGQ